MQNDGKLFYYKKHTVTIDVMRVLKPINHIALI